MARDIGQMIADYVVGAMDDVRNKVVEEPFFGRAVTTPHGQSDLGQANSPQGPFAEQGFFQRNFGHNESYQMGRGTNFPGQQTEQNFFAARGENPQSPGVSPGVGVSEERTGYAAYGDGLGRYEDGPGQNNQDQQQEHDQQRSYDLEHEQGMER